MFEDGRSKKVIFIAHCILNQNSISDGTAVFPAAFKNVIKILFPLERRPEVWISFAHAKKASTSGLRLI